METALPDIWLSLSVLGLLQPIRSTVGKLPPAEPVGASHSCQSQSREKVSAVLCCSINKMQSSGVTDAIANPWRSCHVVILFLNEQFSRWSSQLNNTSLQLPGVLHSPQIGVSRQKSIACSLSRQILEITNPAASKLRNSQPDYKSLNLQIFLKNQPTNGSDFQYL